MFTVGIGPSSSHTVGPMRAGAHFADLLASSGLQPSRIQVTLQGSLAATGIGHGTNRAVLLGLGGAQPATVTADEVDLLIPKLASSGTLPLASGSSVRFNLPTDLLFKPQQVDAFHPNSLVIQAWGPVSGRTEPATLSRTYFSTGGGFVLVQNELDQAPTSIDESDKTETAQVPLPFSSGDDLLTLCEETGLTVAELVRINERTHDGDDSLNSHLDSVVAAMFDCVKQGCETEGVLPGGLGVPRRAVPLRERLQTTLNDPLALLDWVTLFALAVNEENAAGHRVVTAPTNGAAGIIPAVLGHLLLTKAAEEVGGLEKLAEMACLWDLEQVMSLLPQTHLLVRDFLLAASAVGSIIKVNASIAGAEVGCQGEVGSASAMAAAGLTQALGGSALQVENAAEIAVEHSLGLTCDPVGGLVQIPCIERNAVGAVKALSAARMALYGDGRHQVSLDVAVETMRQTGADMHTKYKETSIGGLAVNVVEC